MTGRHPGPGRQRTSEDVTTSTTQRTPAPAAIVGVRKIFAAETGNYFLLLGTTLFLVVFGLVMVLSSSSVSSYTETDDFFSGFMRQGLFAIIGVPIMLLASRAPASFWKKWAGAAIFGSVILQILVVATPLGVSRGGNTNWLALGSFTVQPSEFTKVSLVIWIASVLSTRMDRLKDVRQMAWPIGPVAGAAMILVLTGGDLGTVTIIAALVLGSMYLAGVSLRLLAIPVGLAAVFGPIAAFSRASRSDRIDAWLSGCSSPNAYVDTCWQTVHGWWALAAGGIFGSGLGNSKAKWLWLPEASSDFIFAIIGEELGLLGAITVLLLFIVLAFAFVRIIRANSDPFARIAVGGILIWIVSQAFVNIAVVLGVLPVLGVPLPLMSSGGSALTTTLLAIGIALSFARNSSSATLAPRASPGPPR